MMAACKKLHNKWIVNKAVCYVEPLSNEQGEGKLDSGIDINKVMAFNNGDATYSVCATSLVV